MADEIDYTRMQASEMLGNLGDDGAKWAAAFRQHAEKLGHAGMDEGWLAGWFANAIEHSSDVRRWAAEPTPNPASPPAAESVALKLLRKIRSMIEIKEYRGGAKGYSWSEGLSLIELASEIDATLTAAGQATPSEPT